ncbi:MAG: hypothetical protein O7F73_08065 [Gammaproteobacteria bacterium]|nr:hypothetical protein [Gammaproteobacteria bacterium]
MTLAHDPDADTLRAEITELWGHDGLISLGFTISASRVYPTLKYVLGNGQACSHIRIEEKSVIPEKMSAGEIAI